MCIQRLIRNLMTITATLTAHSASQLHGPSFVVVYTETSRFLFITTFLANVNLIGTTAKTLIRVLDGEISINTASAAARYTFIAFFSSSKSGRIYVTNIRLGKGPFIDEEVSSFNQHKICATGRLLVHSS